MSTLGSQPLSLLHLNFDELYARHLCRHSQYGINVVHLLALFGTWYGVYAIVYALWHAEWVPAVLAGAYVALVAFNVPARVAVATAVFMVIFLAAVYWLPEMPIWFNALLIPICYKLQSWSHKIFTAAADMTEFDLKYPKGPVLFVVLLIYEVPLALNFLVFDRARHEKQ